jgi:hypothetical protein
VVGKPKPKPKPKPKLRPHPSGKPPSVRPLARSRAPGGWSALIGAWRAQHFLTEDDLFDAIEKRYVTVDMVSAGLSA